MRLCGIGKAVLRALLFFTCSFGSWSLVFTRPIQYSLISWETSSNDVCSLGLLLLLSVLLIDLRESRGECWSHVSALLSGVNRGVKNIMTFFFLIEMLCNQNPSVSFSCILFAACDYSTQPDAWI